MKASVLALLLAVALCGCAKSSADGWTFEQNVDPISQQGSVSATKQLISPQDENLVVDAKWTCPSSGQKDPSALQLTLTAYDKSKRVGDAIQGAGVDAETIEYRLDGYGAGQVVKDGAEKFSNEIPLNYLAMVANSEKVAPSVPMVVRMVGPAIGLDPRVVQQLDDALRGATNNFRWASKDLTIRFRASTSVGANDHVFVIPLQNPSVVKVAQACGWHQDLKATVPVVPVNSPSSTGLVGPLRENFVSSATLSCEKRQANEPNNVGISSALITRVCGCIGNYYADRLTNDQVVVAEGGGAPINFAAMTEPARQSCLASAGAQPVSAATILPKGRPAQCDIMLSPTVEGAYQGPCLFEPSAKRDGSFTLTREGGPLTSTVGAITLNVVRPNVGTITTNGAGGAGVDTWDVEFERDGACWVQSGDGEDGASICVK